MLKITSKWFPSNYSIDSTIELFYIISYLVVRQNYKNNINKIRKKCLKIHIWCNTNLQALLYPIKTFNKFPNFLKVYMPQEDNRNEPNGDWNSKKFKKNLFFCYVFTGRRAEAIHHCGQLIFETMYSMFVRCKGWLILSFVSIKCDWTEVTDSICNMYIKIGSFCLP